MRLKLVPDNTNFDFFGYAKITFGASVVAMILSLIAWGVMGLNFGIDFRGGLFPALSASACDVTCNFGEDARKPLAHLPDGSVGRQCGTHIPELHRALLERNIANARVDEEVVPRLCDAER